MRSLRSAVVAATTIALLGLAGCGGSSTASDEPDASASSDASASAFPSPSPSESDTPEPEPAPDKDGDGTEDYWDAYPNDPAYDTEQTVTVICDVKGREDLVFEIDRIKPSFKEAWRTPMPEARGWLSGVYCESEESYNDILLEPVSDVEQTIWDADRKPDEYTIPIPYEQCVEHGTRDMMNEWPRSKAQAKEAKEALSLCPHHPDAAAIRARIADQGVVANQLKTGRAFWDGNYRVGTRIQPGTYFTTGVDGCYWERLDRAGNIIDNNFVSSGLRVEASILASDFSFHTENCGMWRPVG